MRGTIVTTPSELVADAQRRLPDALKASRKALGLTQTELARRVHYDRTTVCHTERGGQVPGAEFWQACDEVLAAGGVLIGLYRRWQAARRAETEAAVRSRRAEWRAAVVEGGSALDRTVQPGSTRMMPIPDYLVSLDPTRFAAAHDMVVEPPPSRVVSADVAVIRSMLAALVASERQFGGGQAREYATSYLRSVIGPRLHAHADTAVRRELFAVSTEFALRVSSMHLDIGDVRTCRGLLATAASLAHESEDLTLSAWVLARSGEQEFHERKAGQAVALTGGAVAVARQAPPRTRAFILGKHALALSLAGDRAATVAALGRARDAYGEAGRASEPAWMGRYDWGHQRHDEGRAYCGLGMGVEAAGAAEECLRRGRRGRLARPRAFSLGIQAIGYAQAGELERACAAGHELVAAAGQLASERVRLRLVDVLEAVRPHQDSPVVRDLYEAARPAVAKAPA